MCGIFGMVGIDSVKRTINALKHLEYRGYDSVGLSVKQDKLLLFKKAGRVQNLQGILPQDLSGQSAIGHTRWATHGAVSDQNAHPFLSYGGNFAVVHNGILENYRQLKAYLPNVTFSSQTDSEVVAHLLESNFDGEVFDALLRTAKQLVGSFAIVVQNTHDNVLYALKRQSPLIVGLSNDGAYLSSDVRCLSSYASKVAVTPDDTVVVATQKGIAFYDFDGKVKQVEFFEPQVSMEILDNDGDKMLNEIYEIPQRIAQTKKSYKTNPLNLPMGFVSKLNRIYFIGCGTAYHAGLQVASIMRKYLSVDLFTVVASEFIYDDYPVDNKTLAFCISQSGETADTLRAVERVGKLGGYCYAVTNTTTSTICQMCKSVANVCAGGEFAVASTKAYNCQLVTLLLLCLDIARAKRSIDDKTYRTLNDGIDLLPLVVDKILANANAIERLAQIVKDSTAVFYLGRTIDYPTACEGSLKLKEISYIHSEAYPAGELKHGTLALMESGVTVVALCTQYDLFAKMESSVCEVVSRGARVVSLSPYHLEGAECLTLPVVNQALYPIVSVVPLQLLAYYVAKALGRDVDKPRNLAKSVTVE